MSDPDIFSAIEAHDIAQLSTLLQDGKDPNAVSDAFPHLRPLHAAIVALGEGGSLVAVDLLLRYGADLDATFPGIGATTPLLCALFNDESAAARHLLEKGADASKPSDEGDSPLRWAVDNGDIEMLGLLLQNGAARSIDSSSAEEGRTALGMAVHRLDVEMVRRLLDAGADPHVRDFNRDTAEECLPPWNIGNHSVWTEVRSLLDKAASGS